MQLSPRYIFLLLPLMLLFLAGGQTQAAPGDTIVVQTFTFDSITTRRAVFRFPEGKTYERIIMRHTLKCDPRTTRDQYDCGEWDYTTHSVIYDHSTGSEDPVPYEIGRFITPYGLGLDLGPEGFTWELDVTDYAQLLQGDVDIRAGNNQELLDLQFIMIEGTPPRDVIKLENVYDHQSRRFDVLADDEHLTAQTVDINASTSSVKLKTRISGHGHAGPRNCCEWDPKAHNISIDGKQRFEWTVWKDCGLNPVYPQGGTWPFDRAGWCPGDWVDEHEFEAGDYLTPGQSAEVDYGIEPYSDNGEASGNYIVSMQMVQYGSINHELDMRIEDIIAPTDKDKHSRINPICNEPTVVIRNVGSETVTSATLTYNVNGNTESVYYWYGELAFNETDTVVLPRPIWDGVTKSSQFVISVTAPNGSTDEYAPNNTRATYVTIPVVFPEDIIIILSTQDYGRASEGTYQIINIEDEVVYERTGFEDNQLYRDTVKLGRGQCYQFRYIDANEDGLIRHWWNPNATGRNGIIRILKASGGLIDADMMEATDFGPEESMWFTVVHPLNTDEVPVEDYVEVYPNPASDQLTVGISLKEQRDLELQLIDASGKVIRQASRRAFSSGQIEFNVSGAAPGVYVLTVKAGTDVITRKVVLDR